MIGWGEWHEFSEPITERSKAKTKQFPDYFWHSAYDMICRMGVETPSNAVNILGNKWDIFEGFKGSFS